MIKPKIQLEIIQHLLELRQTISGSSSDITINIKEFLASHPNVRDLDIEPTLKALKTEIVTNTNLWTGEKLGKESVIRDYIKNSDSSITITNSSTPKLEEYIRILKKVIGKGDLQIDPEKKRIYFSNKEMFFSDTGVWYFIQGLYENFNKVIPWNDLWNYVDEKSSLTKTSTLPTEATKQTQVRNAIGQIRRRMRNERVIFFGIETDRKKGYKMTR